MQRRQVFIADLVAQPAVLGGDFLVDLLQLIIDFYHFRVAAPNCVVSCARCVSSSACLSRSLPIMLISPSR